MFEISVMSRKKLWRKVEINNGRVRVSHNVVREQEGLEVMLRSICRESMALKFPGSSSQR